MPYYGHIYYGYGDFLDRPGEASSRGYFRAASNRRIWSEMLHR